MNLDPTRERGRDNSQSKGGAEFSLYMLSIFIICGMRSYGLLSSTLRDASKGVDRHACLGERKIT